VDSRVVRFRTAAEGRVTDLAFFPDGRSFLAVRATIERFSAETDSVIEEPKAPGYATILSIAVSPDGRFLATTAHLSMLSGEFHLVVADLVQEMARAIHGISGCSVAFTSDSTFAITGGLGAPQIWNAEMGARVDHAK